MENTNSSPKKVAVKKVTPKKVKTVKPAKVKVAKAPKAKKPPKTPKTPKVKKVRVKKVCSKSFVKKLVTVAVSGTLVLAVLASVGYVFTLNDFAMTTIISNDVEKSVETLNDVLESNFKSRYQNMTVTFSLLNSANLAVIQTQSYEVKSIKDNDNTYWYSIEMTMNDLPYNLYYKNNKFYAYYSDLYVSSANYGSAQASIVTLPAFQMFSQFPELFPSVKHDCDDISFLEDTDTSFVFNKKPFYFGEKFELTYKLLESRVNNFTDKQIYEVDHLGNLRYKKLSRNTDGYLQVMEIEYKTVNEIFELEFPIDINLH